MLKELTVQSRGQWENSTKSLMVRIPDCLLWSSKKRANLRTRTSFDVTVSGHFVPCQVVQQNSQSFHTKVRLFDQEVVRKIVKVVGMVHLASLFSMLDVKFVTVFMALLGITHLHPQLNAAYSIDQNNKAMNTVPLENLHLC